jgi:CheY-like chemotaxis protein
VVVEDNPADAMLIRESLNEHGIPFQLNVVRDGEAAITMIEEMEGGASRCPDLVILDLNLPRRSGYEVLQRIRSGKKCGSVPVVILTSSQTLEERDRALALGANRFLTKPPLFEDFISLGAIFRDLLNTHRS